ncbi:sigma-54-dependent transcriptional regulator [Pelobacter seleniigenes]|uniref:sigma-54-dependent transcriptional regulator n=1 Tax=Pelobacter seleniigenes TaxID=407188 RepID=UPI0004A6FB33|nr:sigma-54 dependent transcriptional regulator [Pelobacter seleniigenes]
MKGSILIVDDERNVRVFLRELFEQDGYEVFAAGSIDEAKTEITKNSPEVVVLDLGLPDGSGHELIPFIKNNKKNTEVVVITAMGTIDNAVDSMRLGAYDFISKPFDTEKILISCERAVKFAKVSRENTALKRQQKNHIYFEEFIGECPETQKLKKLIHKLAFVDVPILITGETGTGKNILAKQIHFTCADENKPVVYTNCSSLPETLFESELFGHEKGAFTGASTLKKGRVEEADGGTLILDEITEIPYELQAKLLNFIQERCFYRVGGNRHILVNTRIIALSNRNMSEEVEAGRFRKDLFYRLNVVHMKVPPLKERGSDIALLTRHFMDILKTKYGKDKQLSPLAFKLLQTYSWPGNVRELKNTLERAFIFSEDEVIKEGEIVFEGDATSGEQGDLKSMLSGFEKTLIIQTLAAQGGNRANTAAELGISLRNLQYKLSRYDLID